MGRNSTLYNNVKTYASGDKEGTDTGVTTGVTGPDGNSGTGVSF
jgi:hypothetical protein